MATASISLAFLVTGVAKIFLKITGKNKHRKITLLGRSKLNNMEKIISKAMLDSNISHDEFMLVINEEKIILG